MIKFCLDFHALNAKQVYDMLALRSEVFVVEQNCVYQDPDFKDIKCKHIFYYSDDDKLIGYARVVPPGLSFPDASIGRIVIATHGRGQQYGRDLVEYALRECKKSWPKVGITIGAQCYLEKFYCSLGFESFGEQYLEDGIPHIDMKYKG